MLVSFCMTFSCIEAEPPETNQPGRMMPRLYTRNPTRLYTRENNSVVHANADAYHGVDGDDDDDGGGGGADDDDDDGGGGGGNSKEVEQRLCPYNEVKQQVWLVDPTLFLPSPTPPPKVEV